MVVRESYRLPGGMGMADELFSDYRDVDGLKVAFKASVRRNAARADCTVTDVKVNVPFDPALFIKPER